MPFEYAWQLVLMCTKEEEVEVFLDAQKSYLVDKSQPEPCTKLCASSAAPHSMQYAIYKCNSSVCRNFASAADAHGCEWFVHIRTCHETKHSSVYQHGSHLACAMSPKRGALNLQMKRHARVCADRKIKPSPILNQLIDLFKIEDATGMLSKVQSFVTNYKRTKLSDNNYLDEMVRLAALHRYHDDVDDLKAFVFGFPTDDNGAAILGTGTGQDPLVIGCTSKVLLRNLQHAAHYTLHIDATFKLSAFGFPVIVLGVSDLGRQFHPVSFFLVSDLKQGQNQRALQTTLDMYRVVTGVDAQVRFFMADADHAERNACEASVLPGSTPTYEMCWFHVMQNVKKYTSSLSAPAKRFARPYCIQTVEKIPVV